MADDACDLRPQGSDSYLHGYAVDPFAGGLCFVSQRAPPNEGHALSVQPHAMNLRDGDAKIVKNAGAVVSHPFGGIMRSIIVALYELGCDEVIVVGHRDCGEAHCYATAALYNESRV